MEIEDADRERADAGNAGRVGKTNTLSTVEKDKWILVYEKL